MSAPAPARSAPPAGPTETIARARLASLHGSPGELTEIEAAKRLVDRLLDGNDQELYEMPPCLLLLLMTADWCRPGEDSIPTLLRTTLSQRIGLEVPLVGGSMARLYCSADDHPDIEHGMAVAMLCSNDLRFTVGHLKEIRGHSDQRVEDLRKLCTQIEAKVRAEPGLGSSSDKDLIVFFPGYRDNRTKNYDHDLFGEIMEGFGKKYAVFGASTANQIKSTTGFQFADNCTMESGLAIALMESDARIGSALEHGFEPIKGLERISIDELQTDKLSSHWVKTVNGQPAAKFFRELQESKKFILGFPVLGLPDGPDYNIFYPLGDLTDDTQPVFLNRAVRKGDRAYLLDTNPERIKSASRKAVREALNNATLSDSRPALMIAFPCVSRYVHYETWGFNWIDVVEEVLRGQPGIPLLAGLSAGEFGKDEWRRPRSNNLSAWVAVIGSGRNRRGLNRERLGKLRSAAEKVFRAKTSKAVMATALQGAIEAGAEGGQICIVDRENGWILGRDYGMAGRAPHSTQNWELALKDTRRRLIKSEARGLPRKLKRFSVPMEVALAAGRPGYSKEYVPDPTDDILSISVLTQNAIFVTDSSKKDFQNDHELANFCAIKSYLVIPLPGSGDEAIATMQVGFKEGTSLDRELISFWASYGQKVGQALARAWEAEERQTLETFNRRLREICSRPISNDWTSENEVRELLTVIQDCLDVEYVSSRIRLQRGAQEFELCAPLDRIAEIHRAVRPKIRQGQGSCDTSLPRIGKFWNSYEEIQDLCKQTSCDQATVPDPPRADLERYREEGQRHRSRAVFPVWLGEDRYEGSIAIASYRETFFDERRKRLVRAAGESLTRLLETRRSVWENHYRSEQQERATKGKTELLPLLINVVNADRDDWSSVLAHLAVTFDCEFAGLHLPQAQTLDGGRTFYHPQGGKCPDQFHSLPQQASRFLVAPAALEHYSAQTDFEIGHWMTGLKSALIVGVVGSDGVPRGVLMLANRHPGNSPFGFDDPLEHQLAHDIASSLADAAAARASRRTTLELRSQMDQAIKVGAAGLFGSLIVHQLNTGLANIQMGLDILQRNPDALRDVLADLAHERSQLQTVVQQLAHRPIVGRQKEELRNLVKLALSISQPEKHAPALHLVIRNEARETVDVDVWQIVFGIVNVLDNAIEAAGRPGVVEIRSGVEGEMGVIRIRNSGSTPPAEVRARMFRPSFSLKPGHLGLGLALANDAFSSSGGGIIGQAPEEGGFEMIMKIPLAGRSVEV